MACDTLEDKDGRVVGFVCSDRRRGKRRCAFCGKPATLLCDGAKPGKKSGTCDADLCASCARNVGPDRDLCPRCVGAQEAMPAPKRDTAKSRDCPVCPSCKVPAGSTTNPETSEPEPYDPGARRLTCLACGHRWQGTLEEYLQARAADEAWVDAEISRIGKAKAEAKRAEEREKYERAMKGQW